MMLSQLSDKGVCEMTKKEREKKVRAALREFQGAVACKFLLGMSPDVDIDIIRDIKKTRQAVIDAAIKN